MHQCIVTTCQPSKSHDKWLVHCWQFLSVIFKWSVPTWQSDFGSDVFIIDGPSCWQPMCVGGIKLSETMSVKCCICDLPIMTVPMIGVALRMMLCSNCGDLYTCVCKHPTPSQFELVTQLVQRNSLVTMFSWLCSGSNNTAARKDPQQRHLLNTTLSLTRGITWRKNNMTQGIACQGIATCCPRHKALSHWILVTDMVGIVSDVTEISSPAKSSIHHASSSNTEATATPLHTRLCWLYSSLCTTIGS